MRTGDLAKAASLARSAEAMARVSHDQRRQGLATAQLADVFIQEGRFTDALSVARDCHALFDAVGDKSGVALANLRVADCLAYMGQHAEAMPMYQHAADYYRSSSQGFNVAWAEYGIGYIHLQRKETADAEAHLSKALAGYQAAGATSYAAKVASALSDLARMNGDLDAARVGYQRVAAFLEAVGDVTSAVTYLNLALVAFAADDTDTAAKWTDRCRRALQVTPQRHLLAAVEICSLGIAAHRGDWEAWEQHLPRIPSMLANSGILERDDAWMCEKAADLTLRAGDSGRALRAYEISLDLWRRLGLQERTTAAETKVRDLS